MARITIKDVAKSLELSVSTVSRALNDKGDVDEKTREKVKNRARELGYTPNMMAKALKGKTLGLLGVIIDDNTNPFYAEVVKGMEREAKKHGFHLLLVNTAADYEEQVFAIEFLQNKGVDGILIAPVDDTKPVEMDGIKVPFVIVGRHFEKSDFCEVYNDEELGGYIATRHLLEAGRSNIITVQPDMNIFPTRGRSLGYRKALQEYSSGTCDAVFAYNDMYALEIIALLRSKGIRVPEEIAVVGYDDIPYSVYVCPKLTSVALDKDWLGRTSTEMLIKMIKGKKIREKRYVQKPVLRVRDSG